MIVVQVENIKAALAKAFDPVLISLLSGKETQVKPDVFMKLTGNLDFSVRLKTNAIQLVFKLRPQVRVNKFINLYGDLAGIIIEKNGITLEIDGLPDVFLEAIS